MKKQAKKHCYSGFEMFFLFFACKFKEKDVISHIHSDGNTHRLYSMIINNHVSIHKKNRFDGTAVVQRHGCQCAASLYFE